MPEDPNRWPLARALVSRILNVPTIRPLNTQQRVKARDLLSVQYESNTRILAADVSAGQTVDSWYASMREIIGSYARQMATAGAGTIPRQPVRDAVDRNLSGQWGYLDRFAEVLDAGRRFGNMLSEAAIAARSMLYGSTGIGAWWRGAEPVRSGVVVYYIARDTGNTCSNCSAAASNGPYDASLHPYPGEVCLGGSRCRCTLRYEHNPDLAAQIRSQPVNFPRRTAALVPDIVFPLPDPIVVRQPAPVVVAQPPVVPPPTPTPARPTDTGASDARSKLQQVEQRFADRIRKAEETRTRYERSSADLAALTRRQDEILVESANATPERRKELSAESKQINKSIKEIRKLRDTYVSDIAPAYAERAAVGRQAVYVTDPASNQLNITDRLGAVDVESRRRAIEGIGEFNKLVSRNVLNGDTINYALLGPGQRAHYDSFFNEIYLNANSGTQTVVHELAHSIEYRVPGITEKVRAFFERRTRGEEWQSLRDLTGKQYFGADEVAKPDRFIDPYIGRRNSERSSEIVSMGLQYMYEDPIRFAREDPDMFDFIYDLVRGL